MRWGRIAGGALCAGTVLAVVGGIAYRLAGRTIAFTDGLDFLFPAAGRSGVWARGAGLLTRA